MNETRSPPAMQTLPRARRSRLREALASLSKPPQLSVMSLKIIAALCAALCVGACATGPAPAQTSPTIGRLYTYVRSNQDGTRPENVYVYRAGAAQLEVAKMVSRCTNAAFVTAELDLARRQPLSLVGGRLARDGTQTPFAWLTYDRTAHRLHAQVPSADIDRYVSLDGEPWTIYDFDLADITALNAGHAPTPGDFDLAVALVWPAQGARDPFRNLGRAWFRYAGGELRLEREALRFEASGGLNGQLWLDAREGHVLEARFAEPNHAEYRDFRLVLERVEDNAAARWAAVRAAHWADCP